MKRQKEIEGVSTLWGELNRTLDPKRKEEIRKELDEVYYSNEASSTLKLTNIIIGMLKLYKVVDVVKFLIDKGVDINVTDQYGLSPLVYALKTKNKAMVDLIRSAGGEY